MNYNRNTAFRLFAALALPLVLSSCSKTGEDDVLDKIKPTPVIDKTIGIYVLNEGYMGAANSSITYHDIVNGKTEADIYRKVNGKDLGESANDLQKYGSKMYCVVSGDFDGARSFVIVMDAKSGKVLKEISFNENGKGIMPRCIAFSGTKAYVSAYDGSISRIDTASLAVDKKIVAGNALEGLAIASGKIYAANTANTFRVPGSGNNKTVSVVQLDNFTKIKDIEVGSSPTRVEGGPEGTVLVTFMGTSPDYIPGAVKISTVSDQKIAESAIEINSLAFSDNMFFVVGGAYNGTGPFISRLDYASLTRGNNFITDQTPVLTPYALTSNPFDKSLLISDANGYAPSGQAFYFSAAGRKQVVFPTGANPQKAVFVYSYK